jgi:hypothetical protein
MSYIQGFNRKQAVLIPETIEQLIAENNPVRFIDAFVNSQDIVALSITKVDTTRNVKISVVDQKIVVNSKEYSITIYNMFGQTIKNESLSSGIYIVKTTSRKGKIKTTKIIIS